MITNVNVHNQPFEFRGLSTDKKPTLDGTFNGVQNGAIFLEMDTSKVFMFDAVSKTWKEL